MKKKIFSSWLLDIAKYITTAMIISVALGAIEYGWIYYAVSISLVVFIVLLGFALVDDDKPKKKKKSLTV
jgi:ABC-type multidrug transport system permease subunit